MKTKHYLFALLPISVIGIALRFFEIIFGIEAESGYYAVGSVLPYIFDGFCILVALFFLSAMFIIPKEKTHQVSRFYAFFGAEPVIILLAAVGILATGTYGFISSVFGENGYASVIEVLKDVKFWTFILSVLSALYFTVLATVPRRPFSSLFYKIISLSTAALYLIKLLSLFLTEDTLLSHAYATYSLIFYGFTVLFFMNFSKFSAKMPAMRYLTAYGCAAAFFGALRVAEFVLSFIPKDPYNISSFSENARYSVDILPYISDFLIVAAVVVFVRHLTFRALDVSEAELDRDNFSREQAETLEAGLIANEMLRQQPNGRYTDELTEEDDETIDIINEMRDDR